MISKVIKDKIDSLNKTGFKFKDEGDACSCYVPPYITGLNSSSQVLKDLTSFNDGKLTTFSNKFQLLNNLDSIYRAYNATVKAPNITLKRILSTPGVKELLEERENEKSVIKNMYAK